MNEEKPTLLSEFQQCLNEYQETFDFILETIINVSSNTNTNSNSNYHELENQTSKLIHVDSTLKSLIKKHTLWVNRNKEIQQLENEYKKLDQKITKFAIDLSTAQMSLMKNLSHARKLQENVNNKEKSPTVQEIVAFSKLISPAAPVSSTHFKPFMNSWLPDINEMQQATVFEDTLEIHLPKMVSETVPKEPLQTAHAADRLSSEYEYSD